MHTLPSGPVRFGVFELDLSNGKLRSTETTDPNNKVLRSGHADPEKTDMLKQLWMFQDLTGVATDQLAISLQEIPPRNAMEMGQIMPAVAHK
jgi:hypothetical protein